MRSNASTDRGYAQCWRSHERHIWRLWIRQLSPIRNHDGTLARRHISHEWTCRPHATMTTARVGPGSRCRPAHCCDGLHRPHHRPIRRRHHPSPTRGVHLRRPGHQAHRPQPRHPQPRNAAGNPVDLVQSPLRIPRPGRVRRVPPLQHSHRGLGTWRPPQLHAAFELEVPIIWLQTISPGRFVSVAPIYLVKADPQRGQLRRHMVTTQLRRESLLNGCAADLPRRCLVCSRRRARRTFP